VSILRRIKSFGVHIALDDFGKGYSSLSYLQKFPFDKIKIDRSFISDVGTSQQSIAIVHAVVGLGRSLNIPILAEGVETKAQFDFLAKEGCNEVQGYLTGKPLAISEYAAVIGRKLEARAKAS
jgi:EAL domain-containing protein (putative c-di-GMP-specific phosphodiesterase class I)